VNNDQGFIQSVPVSVRGRFPGAGRWRTVIVPLGSNAVRSTQANWGDMRRLELYCDGGRRGKRCAFEIWNAKLVRPSATERVLRNQEIKLFDALSVDKTLSAISSGVPGTFTPAENHRDVSAIIDPLSKTPTKPLPGTLLSFKIKSDSAASFPNQFEFCNVNNDQGFIQSVPVSVRGRFPGAGRWRTVIVPLGSNAVRSTQANWGDMRRLELYCDAGRRGKRCAFDLSDVKLVFPALDAVTGTSLVSSDSSTSVWGGVSSTGSVWSNLGTDTADTASDSVWTSFSAGTKSSSSVWDIAADDGAKSNAINANASVWDWDADHTAPRPAASVHVDGGTSVWTGFQKRKLRGAESPV